MLIDGTAHLVASDRAIREWVCEALPLQAIRCSPWDSISTFEDGADTNDSGCILLHTGPAGDEGIEKLMSRATSWMPVIVLCEPGDVDSAIDALKLGAVDVAERTISAERLVAKIYKSFQTHHHRRAETDLRGGISERLLRLSARERDVAQLVCFGLSNKQIAKQLNISGFTVANHRMSLHTKLEIQNTAELMGLMMMGSCPGTLSAGAGPAGVLPPCLACATSRKLAA